MSGSPLRQRSLFVPDCAVSTGPSSPSGHEPQRPTVQPEHVLKLFNILIAIADALSVRAWPSRRTRAPTLHPRLYIAAGWELAVHGESTSRS